MKEISCNIIRDILPLYVDEAVCEETKELVEEHLFTCEDCRKEAEMMKKSVDKEGKNRRFICPGNSWSPGRNLQRAGTSGTVYSL